MAFSDFQGALPLRGKSLPTVTDEKDQGSQMDHNLLLVTKLVNNAESKAQTKKLFGGCVCVHSRAHACVTTKALH